MDIEKRCLHVAREAITKRVKTAQGKQTCLVWDFIEAIRFKHPHTMVNIHNIGVLESRVGWWENNSKSSAEASPQLISWWNLLHQVRLWEPKRNALFLIWTLLGFKLSLLKQGFVTSVSKGSCPPSVFQTPCPSPSILSGLWQMKCSCWLLGLHTTHCHSDKIFLWLRTHFTIKKNG